MFDNKIENTVSFKIVKKENGHCFIKGSFFSYGVRKSGFGLPIKETVLTSASLKKIMKKVTQRVNMAFGYKVSTPSVQKLTFDILYDISNVS